MPVYATPRVILLRHYATALRPTVVCYERRALIRHCEDNWYIDIVAVIVYDCCDREAAPGYRLRKS